MPVGLVYNAYYAKNLYDYRHGNRTLFYTSLSNSSDVCCINEPVLDWDISKAGNITFILAPSNDAYAEIVCDKGFIFVERHVSGDFRKNPVIWHGRAISDSYDIDRNREILCEGALNLLLDTTIKPYNSLYRGNDSELFNYIIEEHNRSLMASSSIVMDQFEWLKIGDNGSTREVYLMGDQVYFLANESTLGTWNLGVWSNPAFWKYREHVGAMIHMSFDLSIIGGDGSNDFVRYGLHLRDAPFANSRTARLVFKEGPSAYESRHVDYSIFLGPGGLDGTGYENSYIGFHLYLNAKSGVTASIKNIKVVAETTFPGYEDKVFDATSGKRSGILRIPFHDETVRALYQSEYPTVLDMLTGIYSRQYGGHIYVDYVDANGNETDNPTINYIYGTAEKDSVGDDIPEIEYGKNLLSYKHTLDYEQFPTIIIPLGRRLESWEKAFNVLGSDQRFYSNGYTLDKDGATVSGGAGDYIATFPVSSGEVYYASGRGKMDLGLYSILNANNQVIENRTFSYEGSNDWYQNVEIAIPDGGVTLKVYFYNEAQTSPVTSALFALTKYANSNIEEYLTLDGYIGNRAAPFAGTKFVPIYNDPAFMYEYGWIEEVVHIDSAETKDDLYAKAIEYINPLRSAAGKPIESYEVEAVEVFKIGEDFEYRPIGMPGSYAFVDCPDTNKKEKLCITKCNINLRDFSKSRYSLENLPPPDLADLIAKGLY